MYVYIYIMKKYFEEINFKIENIYEKHYNKGIFKSAKMKYIK